MPEINKKKDTKEKWEEEELKLHKRKYIIGQYTHENIQPYYK